MNNKIISLLKSVYFSSLASIFLLFFLSFTGFIFHLTISPLYTIISLAFFIIYIIYLLNKNGFNRTAILKTVFIALLTLIITGFISYILIDKSWDGRWYHQTAIIFLKNGWNPVYDNIYDFSKNIFNNHFAASGGLIWVEHYTKFSEIMAANIYALTQKIETGKIINYIFALLTFIHSLVTLNNIYKKNLKLNIFTSALIILNPVVICQIATYYVDGLMYLAFVNIIFSMINIEIDLSKKLHTLSLVINLVIFSNIKMSGLPYAFLILLIWLIYLFVTKNKEMVTKFFMPALSIFVILIMLSGINPYLSNIKTGGHIFYPVMGQKKIEIIEMNTPEVIRHKDLIYKLFYSTFGKETNLTSDSTPKFKVPLKIANKKLFSDADVRIGGFGHFWSAIILVVATLMFGLRFKDKNLKKIFIFLMAECLIAVIINPEAWWARYVPWLWLLPVIVGYFSFLEAGKNSKRKKLSIFILIIIVANSLIVLYENFHATLKSTRKTSKYLGRITKTVKLYENQDKRSSDTSYIIKLQERNIDYTFVCDETYKNGCYEPIIENSDGRLFIECDSYK